MVDKAHGGAKRASSDASAGRQPGGQKLARVLGVPDMIVYGLIFMVPIAPMGIYGGVFSESGGMPALVYLVGTLAMVFTGLDAAARLSVDSLAHVRGCLDGAVRARARSAPVGVRRGVRGCEHVRERARHRTHRYREPRGACAGDPRAARLRRAGRSMAARRPFVARFLARPALQSLDVRPEPRHERRVVGRAASVPTAPRSRATRATPSTWWRRSWADAGCTSCAPLPRRWPGESSRR